jgi:bacterioferritin
MKKGPRTPRADKAGKTSVVIDVLNQARADELAAIHQYMAQHYHLDDADYGPVASNLKLIAIDEMRHAEMFAERIYEIGGVPTSTPSKAAVKGQKIKEAMDFDAGEETGAIASYNAFLETCLANRDSISAKLFEQIINEEQAHLSYFENIRDHIEELGAAYLAQIAGGPAESGGPARGFIAAQGGGA